ncbi:ComF family protein [Streptomyces sp. NPDC000594]|uniref:ComF family protein n=1 Tax=Streptomyces sp. NPDC000594 TaxID=3154261 RepID=UPI00331B9032
MRGWWNEISGLVVPMVCGGCGASRTVLCAVCARELHGAAPFRVRPDPEPAGLPPVYASAVYADAVRAVLIAHKERGALGLARPLGAALARAVRAAVPVAGAGPLVLVPVPSARWAVRSRGHDAGRRLARAAAGELRRAGERVTVLPLLRQRREVCDQAGLTAPERVANLSGALSTVPGAAGALTGARVVLVDDLMTTGASLTEAARAVRAAVGGGREGADIEGAGGGVGEGEGPLAPGGNSGGAMAAAVVAVPPMSFP